MNIEILLSQLKNNILEILQDNLVGIYVHGSLAFKCYNNKLSDIDLLIVTNISLSNQEKIKLLKMLLQLNIYAPKKGIELSVVLLKDTKEIEYPTPFDLHFSNMHISNIEKDIDEYVNYMQGSDPDLIAHFMVIKTVGYVLTGLPIDEVFGDVSSELYLSSIKYDIENAIEDIKINPTYIVLNLCRVLGYIEDQLILSKVTGGMWGIKHLPLKYHPLIQDALAEYQDSIVYDRNVTLLDEFAIYMLDKIKTEE